MFLEQKDHSLKWSINDSVYLDSEQDLVFSWNDTPSELHASLS